MTSLRFSWDPVKDAANQRKHGLSFELAARVFDDPLHLSRQDRIEDGEERWQTLGQIGGVVVILVAHTFRSDVDGTEGVRIISARKATKRERIYYEHS